MRIATTFMAILTGTFLFFATGAMADDQVYRWVDENGIVHFGDRPEGHKDAEIVDIHKHSSGVDLSSSSDLSAETGEQADPNQPSYAQQVRDERAAKRAETEAEEEKTAAACDKARFLVTELEPKRRVIVTNEDGTETYVDNVERVEKLNEAKAFVASNCNK